MTTKTLVDHLKGKNTAVKIHKTEPLWKGPEKDGITFSLLTRFLSCRERFRLQVIEGLRPADKFNARMEYGNMWHVCEQAHAANQPWEEFLLGYAKILCKQYLLAQEEIDKWYNVCKVQFPIYVDYWSKHPDVTNRTPLLQEQVFDVPYKLPSGRTVRLRGKWDSVDLIDNRGRKHLPMSEQGKPGSSTAGIYLQENKTKGDIDEEQTQRQLTFDLQTMMYLVALSDRETRYNYVRSKSEGLFEKARTARVLGVRYNVVRRPLSGGKGSIVRHKATKNKPEESKEHYYDRLRQIIDGSGEDAPGPSHFFMRWKVEVTPSDITKFRQQCLDPILEQLCDWYDWIAMRPDDPFASDHLKYQECHAIHWRHPFGCINWLDEGYSSDLDEYLRSGSEVGLRRIDNLFPELI